MPQSKSRKIAILGYRSVGEWRAPRGLRAGALPRLRAGTRRPGQVWGRRGHVAAARFVTSRPPPPPPF